VLLSLLNVERKFDQRLSLREAESFTTENVPMLYEDQVVPRTYLRAYIHTYIRAHQRTLLKLNAACAVLLCVTSTRSEENYYN
jgi:hypothetical protein